MLVLTFQQMQRDVAQHTERLRPFVFAHPARVLMKGHIQDPMQPVLNALGLPPRIAEAHPISRQ